MLSNIIVCLLIFLIPVLVIRLTQSIPKLKKLGNITLCFTLGLLIDVLPFQYDKSFASTLSSVIVAIAIPIMLFGFNILDTRKAAGGVVKAFILQIVSTVVVSSSVALIAGKMGMENAGAYSGMTTGLYIGGTPNLLAVGHALTNGDMNAISSLVVSDTIVGSLYFLLILATGKHIYEYALGTSRRVMSREDSSISECADLYNDYVDENVRLLSIGGSGIIKLVAVFMLAVLCFGIGVLLEILVNGNLDGSLFIIITVSVLGIVGGMIRPIRMVPGSYGLGQYMILVFSMGLGMSIDFSSISTAIKPVFIFCLVVQLGVAVVHMLFCKLFHVDAEVSIVTSIAGIFGPPFVVPIAQTLDDKKLMTPGVLCGVIGLSIGNILGILVGVVISTLI